MPYIKGWSDTIRAKLTIFPIAGVGYQLAPAEYVNGYDLMTLGN